MEGPQVRLLKRQLKRTVRFAEEQRNELRRLKSVCRQQKIVIAGLRAGLNGAKGKLELAQRKALADKQTINGLRDQSKSESARCLQLLQEASELKQDRLKINAKFERAIIEHEAYQREVIRVGQKAVRILTGTIGHLGSVERAMQEKQEKKIKLEKTKQANNLEN